MIAQSSLPEGTGKNSAPTVAYRLSVLPLPLIVGA
jgi:hypothetical protein